jgi:hypothetical protein
VVVVGSANQAIQRARSSGFATVPIRRQRRLAPGADLHGEMNMPRPKFRGRWATLAVGMALAWFGTPHPAGGFWRGGCFECLCSADVVAEFRDGQVVTHLDPWPGPSAPAAIRRVISTKPAGSFRRTGWHSFEWSQPTSRGGVRRLQFRPGWIFCRVEDLESREVWWGVRECNLSRIMHIQEDRVDGLPLALGEVLEESLASDLVLSEATHAMLIHRHTSEGRGRNGVADETR